jgi:hypothetical protein
MAAPMVAGTAALMIQANPKLTPNLVKAIIEYTSQDYHYDALTQGAGFLNSRGAVDLARFYATAKSGQVYPMNWAWSKTILWGNYRLNRGVIRPAANAFKVGTVWGSVRDAAGENIVWGTSVLDGVSGLLGGLLSTGENIVWGTTRVDENIVWGTLRDAENIVWGTTCGADDCFNIVWGTSLRDAENIVWGTSFSDENIVWGTSGSTDNILWATSDEAGEPAVLFDDLPVGPVSFESLFPPELADPVTTVTTTVTGLLGGL